MLSLTTVVVILSKYGYLLLLPLAIIEGPIVSIIAGFLVSQHIFGFVLTAVVVVLGDLIGDALHYAAGRWGHSWLARRFTSFEELGNGSVAEYLRAKPGRALVFGKLTHSAGFAFLVASGAVRVPFGTFLLFNLISTIPKSLFFLGIGYFFGSSYMAINSGLGKIVLVLFLAVAAFVIWFIRNRILTETKLDV